MDTFSLIAAERTRLADELDSLAAQDWTGPSLCGEWSVHEVAAHLNVPFEVSTLGFVVGLAKARGNFDRANARFAADLAARWDPAACVAGLRANAAHRFTPPGFGPEAPLTDVIVHGIDALRPSGRSVAVAPEALGVSLRFALSPKAGRAFVSVPLGDLRLAPDDVDLVVGDGDATVAGPARSILGAVAGRRSCLDDLSGEGADRLRQRLS